MKFKQALTIGLFSLWLAVIVTWLCQFAYASDNYLKSKVFQLQGLMGLCTGVQVRTPNHKDYILTAGHCRDIMIGDQVWVKTEDGQEALLSVVADDPKADLLLMEGFPGIKGLPIADVSQVGDRVRVFGRGHRKKAFVNYGEILEFKNDTVMPYAPADEVPTCGTVEKYFILGKFCMIHVHDTLTSAVIVPGMSGGPVVNDSGEITGINSSYSSEASSYASLEDIKRFLHDYSRRSADGQGQNVSPY